MTYFISKLNGYRNQFLFLKKVILKLLTFIRVKIRKILLRN